MEGLQIKKYLQTTRKRFDPLALIISALGILVILGSIGGIESKSYFFDLRSIFIVVLGTFSVLLFQFDFSSCINAAWIVLKSFLGTPQKPVLGIVRQLNDAIVNNGRLVDMREGSEITGELLNDIIYMHNQGLVYEEIDEFVTSRISDEYLERKISVTILNRAAVVAPSLGLFGTVVGLIGVLTSLTEPGQIGPSMSLALMTTAYGAGLGTLGFMPLGGRIEHHNEIYLEIHKQILSKVSILLTRAERSIDTAEVNVEVS